MFKKLKTVVVTGPTATGKTALAVELARRFNGEVVSIDSRQVYRGMDLGTGKDLEEYGEVPYHLIDIVDPATEEFNLSWFCKLAYPVIADITARGKLPILCGGTVLYLAALIDGYRLPGGALPRRDSGIPRERRHSGELDSFHPPFELDALLLGVYYPRAEVHRRIELRLDQRLAQGMVQEVCRLRDERGISYEKLEYFGLEYREIAYYLKGECSLEEMRDRLLSRIRQFAKRQDIFFRKLEREGHIIHWLRAGRDPDPIELIRRFLADEPLPPPALRMVDTYYSGFSGSKVI